MAAITPATNPPKTPVCNVGIPIIDAYAGFFPIISGVTPAVIPITVFITKNATIDAKPAIPSLVSPTATPTQNNSGRLLNIIPPVCSINGIPNLFPRASRSPAAGSTATGVKSAFPIFCNSVNNFIFNSS